MFRNDFNFALEYINESINIKELVKKDRLLFYILLNVKKFKEAKQLLKKIEKIDELCVWFYDFKLKPNILELELKINEIMSKLETKVSKFDYLFEMNISFYRKSRNLAQDIWMDNYLI